MNSVNQPGLQKERSKNESFNATPITVLTKATAIKDLFFSTRQMWFDLRYSHTLRLQM